MSHDYVFSSRLGYSYDIFVVSAPSNIRVFCFLHLQLLPSMRVFQFLVEGAALKSYPYSQVLQANS